MYRRCLLCALLTLVMRGGLARGGPRRDVSIGEFADDAAGRGGGSTEIVDVGARERVGTSLVARRREHSLWIPQQGHVG